ncbi:flavoprotein [Streptomyces sp. NBC_00391]|uniref:flavoprotein n=1 Tax=Streptomyces sp. NBC_00391 TaxID=2903647 RepID=UPI002E1DE324
MTKVLYLISCAAPPVRSIATGIRKAQAAGWEVCLVLTPSAHRWVEPDLAELRELTGHPVRHEYKHPDSADVLPPPDAILVAPVTLNTLTKWADGHADTLALGLVTEALGLELPLVALPFINRAQAAHPALARGVSVLREYGVTMLLGEGGFVPHEPKHGDVGSYPWDAAIAALPA